MMETSPQGNATTQPNREHTVLNRFILPALIVAGLIGHLSAPSINGGTILALAATVTLILRVTTLDTAHHD